MFNFLSKEKLAGFGAKFKSMYEITFYLDD